MNALVLLIHCLIESPEIITANVNLFYPPFPSPPIYSHFLLALLAAGQLVLLVQEVDEGHHQQEQQNAHHHGYHHSAGASLLLVSYSAAMDAWREGWEGQMVGWWDSWGRTEVGGRRGRKT